MNGLGIAIAASFLISLLAIVFDWDKDTDFWVAVNASSGVALLAVVCIGALVDVH